MIWYIYVGNYPYNPLIVLQMKYCSKTSYYAKEIILISGRNLKRFAVIVGRYDMVNLSGG